MENVKRSINHILEKEIHDKYREVKVRQELQSAEHSKLFWAKNYHLNTRGEPLKFDDKPYLVGLFHIIQRYRELAIRKSVQTCISESLIVDYLEEAHKGLSIFGVLPKSDARNTYVQNRVNKLIKTVPFYSRQVKDAIGSSDNVILKGFGKGTLKFVDSNSPANFTEYPADYLLIEEKDRCNQKNLAMARDRLDASPYKIIRIVANPTVENYGIDVDFKIGSQFYWFIKCKHCNFWQTLDWYKNVVRQIGKREFELLDLKVDIKLLQDWTREIAIYCARCNREIDRYSDGLWVEKYPNRDKKSLTLNSLISPFLTLLELVKLLL